MDFKTLIISSVLIGLVVVALLAGFGELAQQNDEDNVLMDNDILSTQYATINNSLGDLQNTTESAKTNLLQDNPNFLTGFFFLSSIINIATSFTTVLVQMFTGSFTIIQSTIGVPPIVTAIFMGIVLIVLVLGAWRVFKAGS